MLQRKTAYVLSVCSLVLSGLFTYLASTQLKKETLFCVNQVCTTMDVINPIYALMVLIFFILSLLLFIKGLNQRNSNAIILYVIGLTLLLLNLVLFGINIFTNHDQLIFLLSDDLLGLIYFTSFGGFHLIKILFYFLLPFVFFIYSIKLTKQDMYFFLLNIATIGIGLFLTLICLFFMKFYP